MLFEYAILFMFKRLMTAVQSSHGDELTNIGLGTRLQDMLLFPPHFLQLQGPIKSWLVIPVL